MLRITNEISQQTYAQTGFIDERHSFKTKNGLNKRVQTNEFVKLKRAIAVLQDFHDLKATFYDAIRQHNQSRSHHYQ